MNAIRVELLLELRARLEAAPRGQRKAILDDMKRFLGVSNATVYRELKSLGYGRDRKRRSDAGKTCVSDKVALLTGGLVEMARRANGKKTLPISTAREILEANGLGCKVNPETGEAAMPSASTISRVMYRSGCHPEQMKQGKTPMQLRSLHPNYAWQMDASLCVVFYLPGGKVRIFEEKENYKNKMHNLIATAPERVVRWVITDHCSGAFFLRYSLGAEDSNTLADVLIEAMCRRDDSENDCLYGVPGILMLDKGSGGRSAQSQNMFAALGIQAITHAVGNPRAKGQVEQAQNLVETQFEGRLRMYSVSNLAELNAAADEWRIMYNREKIHSRHHRTRHAMWRTITEEQLRIPASPDILRECVNSRPERITTPKKLVIGRFIKGFGRLEYDLRAIPGILPKKEIELQVNLYRAPCLDVTIDPDGERLAYSLDPIRRDEYGFAVDAPLIGEEHKAIADNATDTALKTIRKEAYGAATLAEAEAARTAKRPAYVQIEPLADVHAMRPHTYITKRGRDLTLESTTKEEPTLDHVGAAIELRGRMLALGREWTATHMEKLRQLYPERVPSGDMGKLVRLLLDEDATERRAGMRLVAGGAA